MADNVDSQPAERRAQISRRLDDIRIRLTELARAGHPEPGLRISAEYVAAAQHHAALSRAAAEQALASCLMAFRRAADAHDHIAAQYEKCAAPGSKDADRHLQRAAFHRAAATADRQQAEHARHNHG